MLKIGLTGGIGSGKSVVSEHFAHLGVPVIDTDIIARQLVTPGSDSLQAIIDIFGNHFLNTDGSLNRQQLAQNIFNNPTHKQKLEAILHPRINNEIKHQLDKIEKIAGKTRQAAYVIIVIPLLFENHLEDMVDRILVVDADEDQRIQRIMLRDNRDIKEISLIIQNQINDQERLLNADDVVINNNDLAQLGRLVDALHRKYLQMTT